MVRLVLCPLLRCPVVSTEAGQGRTKWVTEAQRRVSFLPQLNPLNQRLGVVREEERERGRECVRGKKEGDVGRKWVVPVGSWGGGQWWISRSMNTPWNHACAAHTLCANAHSPFIHKMDEMRDPTSEWWSILFGFLPRFVYCLYIFLVGFEWETAFSFSFGFGHGNGKRLLS